MKTYSIIFCGVLCVTGLMIASTAQATRSKLPTTFTSSSNLTIQKMRQVAFTVFQRPATHQLPKGFSVRKIEHGEVILMGQSKGLAVERTFKLPYSSIDNLTANSLLLQESVIARGNTRAVKVYYHADQSLIARAVRADISSTSGSDHYLGEGFNAVLHQLVPVRPRAEQVNKGVKPSLQVKFLGDIAYTAGLSKYSIAVGTDQGHLAIYDKVRFEGIEGIHPSDPTILMQQLDHLQKISTK